MENQIESYISIEKPAASAAASDWLRVGVIAAASAVAGGIAAAWWYRRTLNRLQEAGDYPKDTDLHSDFPDTLEEP